MSVVGTINSVQITKEYNGDLAAFEVNVSGKSFKGYGGFPKDLRQVGAQVEVREVGEGRQKKVHIVAASSGGQTYTKQETSYQPRSQQQPAKGGSYAETQERITNDASVNKALEAIRIAVTAGVVKEVDSKGKESTVMTKARLKFYSDPQNVLDEALKLAEGVASTIKSGTFSDGLKGKGSVDGASFEEEAPFDDDINF